MLNAFVRSMARVRVPVHFSSASHALAPCFARRMCSAAPPVVNVMDEVLKTTKHRKVYEALQSDGRVRMPVQEYYDLCRENGVEKDEAEALSTSLHHCGLALRFHEEPFKDVLLLKPTDITNAFLRIVDRKGKYSAAFVKEKEEQLEAAREKLAVLQKEKDELDAVAHRRADQFIGAGCVYLITQGAVVARLTWWELSWDIMEPITYLITFSTSVLAMLFFTSTKTEFTYNSLHETIAKWRMKKIYRRRNFDIGEWHRLTNEVGELERELAAPEVHLLNTIGRKHTGE